MLLKYQQLELEHPKLNAFMLTRASRLFNVSINFFFFSYEMQQFYFIEARYLSLNIYSNTNLLNLRKSSYDLRKSLAIFFFFFLKQ